MDKPSKRAVVVGPFGAVGSTFSFPAHQLGPSALVAISGSFLADATVATRMILVEIVSPDGHVVAWVSLGTVTASALIDFSLASSLTTPPAAALGTTGGISGGLPCCGLWEGCYVRVRDIMGAAAGDSFENMVLAICLD